MTIIERALSEDLAELVDRLATSIPEGAVGDIRGGSRQLRERLDQAESTLATARAALLDDYAKWTRAIEDLENLWAVAALRTSSETETSLAA